MKSSIGLLRLRDETEAAPFRWTHLDLLGRICCRGFVRHERDRLVSGHDVPQDGPQGVGSRLFPESRQAQQASSPMRFSSSTRHT